MSNNACLMRYPCVVWQQQMETATLITYNNNLYQKQIPFWDPDYTINFSTCFRPITFIDDYNQNYIDPDYGRDPNRGNKL